MKKYLFSACLLATSLAASAQFSTSNSGNSLGSGSLTEEWSSIRISYSPITFEGDSDFEYMMGDGDLLDDYNGFAVEYVKGFSIVDNMPIFLEAGFGFQWINWNDEEDLGDYSYELEDYSVKYKLNITSLYVPLNLGYNISLADNLQVMPYVGLNLRCNLTGQYSTGYYKEGYLIDEDEWNDDNPVKIDMLSDDKEKGLGRNNMKRIILGWQIGANVAVNNIHIGVRHGCSFGDEVFNKMNSQLKATTISVGYNF